MVAVGVARDPFCFVYGEGKNLLGWMKMKASEEDRRECEDYLLGSEFGVDARKV